MSSSVFLRLSSFSFWSKEEEREAREIVLGLLSAKPAYTAGAGLLRLAVPTDLSTKALASVEAFGEGWDSCFITTRDNSPARSLMFWGVCMTESMV